MSSHATTERPSAAKAPRADRKHMNIKLKGTIEESRRQAAAILEVLAGVATPTDAAKALSLSLVSYYKLEARALRGLVLGCQPAGRGPRSSPEVEVQKLRRQCQRLQQDVGRYQALVRAAQRAAGLHAMVPAASRDAKGRRKRKPAVRALKAIQTIRSAPPETPSCPTGDDRTGGKSVGLTIETEDRGRRMEPPAPLPLLARRPPWQEADRRWDRSLLSVWMVPRRPRIACGPSCGPSRAR